MTIIAGDAPLPDAGDLAPEFDLPASFGRRVASRALHGTRFVLYLYPKADTAGCTDDQDLLAGFDPAEAQPLEGGGRGDRDGGCLFEGERRGLVGELVFAGRGVLGVAEPGTGAGAGFHQHLVAVMDEFGDAVGLHGRAPQRG